MLARRIRVLIVDDIPANVRLLQAKLEADYYDVITAADGNDAIGQAIESQPDIILLDVMMPGEDGFSLTKSIREKSNVPILLLTARGESVDRIEGLERGADDYLPKPFSWDELEARVIALSRRYARRESGAGAVATANAVPAA